LRDILCGNERAVRVGRTHRDSALKKGRWIASGRGGRPATFLRLQTVWDHPVRALEACSYPPISWYGCTRHAFASHQLIGGGGVARLRVIMGPPPALLTMA